jgi:hypothetical protein
MGHELTCLLRYAASSGGIGDRSGDPTTGPSSADGNGDTFGNERL